MKVRAIHIYFFKSSLSLLVLVFALSFILPYNINAQDSIGYHAIHFKGTVKDLSGNPHDAGLWFYNNEKVGSSLVEFDVLESGVFAQNIGFFTDTTTTGIKEGKNVKLIPEDYTLSAVYPNPTDNMAKIQVGIPEGQGVVVGLYNIRGEEVISPKSFDLNAGTTTFEFLSLDDLATGVYFPRVVFDSPRHADFSLSKKLLVYGSGNEVYIANPENNLKKVGYSSEYKRMNVANIDINIGAQKVVVDFYEGQNRTFKVMSTESDTMNVRVNDPIYEFLLSAETSGAYVRAIFYFDVLGIIII